MKDRVPSEFRNEFEPTTKVLLESSERGRHRLASPLKRLVLSSSLLAILAGLALCATQEISK